MDQPECDLRLSNHAVFPRRYYQEQWSPVDRYYSVFDREVDSQSQVRDELEETIEGNLYFISPFITIKVIALMKQYEELVKFLKENGAFLNDMRPHYLLGY